MSVFSEFEGDSRIISNPQHINCEFVSEILQFSIENSKKDLTK